MNESPTLHEISSWKSHAETFLCLISNSLHFMILRSAVYTESIKATEIFSALHNFELPLLFVLNEQQNRLNTKIKAVNTWLSEYRYRCHLSTNYTLGSQTEARKESNRTAPGLRTRTSTRCLPRSAEVSLVTRFWFLPSIEKMPRSVFDRFI